MTVTSPSGECKAHQLFILNLQCQWITLWPHLKGMCNLIHLFYYSTIRKVNRKLDGKLRGVLCELRQGVLARLVRWAAISRGAWTYLKKFVIILFTNKFFRGCAPYAADFICPPMLAKPHFLYNIYIIESPGTSLIVKIILHK